MSLDKPNQTEFAVGIILACVGAFLLYTEYRVGYWGILALGLVLMVKFWVTSRGEKQARTAVEKSQPSDRMTNDRINH
jgi:hypothetical protein